MEIKILVKYYAWLLYSFALCLFSKNRLIKISNGSLYLITQNWIARCNLNNMESIIENDYETAYFVDCDIVDNIKSDFGKLKSKLLINLDKKKEINDKEYLNNRCVVCYDDDIELLGGKCGHKCACNECFFKLDKCPLCRDVYEHSSTIISNTIVRTDFIRLFL